MDEFKRELNDLLLKHQDLPEFTITIRPRFTIVTKEEKAPVQAVPVPPPVPSVPPTTPPLAGEVDIATSLEAKVAQRMKEFNQ